MIEQCLCTGDMCNGPDTLVETHSEWGAEDIVGVQIDYRTLSFTLNGKKLQGQIDCVGGEVHCAAQLFSVCLVCMCERKRERLRESRRVRDFSRECACVQVCFL